MDKDKLMALLDDLALLYHTANSLQNQVFKLVTLIKLDELEAVLNGFLSTKTDTHTHTSKK